MLVEYMQYARGQRNKKSVSVIESSENTSSDISIFSTRQELKPESEQGW
jgi:hypothetical protein